jgi:signal transduction histidine kinase
VAHFALAGLLATVLIGLLGVAALRHTGTGEAIRNAKQVTRLAGEGIVAPAISPGVLRGRPAALARLDAVVRRRVRRDGIVRVKLWRADGTIIYSDEPRLIGRRYPFGADEAAALRGGRVEAAVSDLSRPENRFERGRGTLLEVYLPIHGPRGPLLFEAYQRFASVSASGRRLWLAFAPALVGGLLLLELINLPLARSLARRLRAGQQAREALLRRALDASQDERRTIAADLHDGVVQDLAGVSFGLAALADRADARDPVAAAALRDGAGRTRASIRALRTLLVDLYPPTLHGAGLGAALEDLATTSATRGLPARVEVPDDLRLGEATERLLFRAAQELLRNAQRHGDAQGVLIAVAQSDDRVTLRMRDDGRGFDPEALAERPREGHFGLRVLGDLVREAGGELAVRSASGAGTQVTVELPR